MDGKAYTMHSNQDEFHIVKSMLIHFDNWDNEDAVDELVNNLIELIDKKIKFENYLQNSPINIENGLIMYNGAVMKSAIVDRLEAVINGGGNYEGIIKFIENMMENPSPQSVNELYLFLEYNSLPITDDGCFFAYKKVAQNVDGDLVDIYSNSFDNNPGAVIEMDRDEVDPDRERTCSYGFHVCSYDYLPVFGSGPSDAVILVKVNPKDVVAVPADYNNAKMRVCRYEVIEIIEEWENMKVKDYFVEGENPEYEPIEDEEDAFEEEDDWQEDDEYDLTEDDGIEYLQAFTMLDYVKWSHAGRTYRGYVLFDILPDEDASLALREAKEDSIDSEITTFLNAFKYENGIRHRYSNNSRICVAVVSVNNELLDKPKLLTPSASVVEYV
jgi:hypothetical protein